MSELEALFDACCDEQRMRRAQRRTGRRGWAMPWWVRLPGGERLYNLKLNGRHPLRLMGSPGAVLPGDARRGACWLAGRQAAEAGAPAFPDRRDPWAGGVLAPRTADALHRFSWLADVAAAGRAEEAAPLAQAWTAAWLRRFGRWGGGESWHPLRTAERLLHWFGHAPLLLSSADLVYRSAVIDSMARQARHLQLQVGRLSADAFAGEELVRVAVALAMAGLLLPYGESWRRQGLDALNHHLYRSRDTSGAPLSRRPIEAWRTLADLLALVRCFRERGEDSPRWLAKARDDYARFVLLFARDDGFANVHGLAGMPEELAERLLSEAGVERSRLRRGAMGGYARLKARRTVVLFDGGPPPPPGFPEATAGLLAFEMAEGPQRLVVNVGPLVANGARLGAQTAAHSTVILGDCNVCPVTPEGLGAMPVTCRFWSGESREGYLAGARHDGYRERFGLDVERRLLLARDGRLLVGEDALLAAAPGRAGRRAKQVPDFAIRFHLDPGVEPALTQGGAQVLLRAGPDRAWVFVLDAVEGVDDIAVSIDESIHLGKAGAQATHQIVVTGRSADAVTRCRWQLRRVEG